jgi:transposase InsO family protein
LSVAIIRLASRYGRYGYRRITAMLRVEGWIVNHKRVERIWRREGLKVPKKQPKRGRLWLNDGSCIRLRPSWPNHVWAYDFVQARTHDGKAFRMLTVIDEYTRECLAILVARRLRSDDVLHLLADLFADRGPPDHIRSDNGSEMPSEHGLEGSASKPCSSNPEAHGRTASTSHSMGNSGTSCSMERSSTHSRRPRCSSNAGDTITTRSDPTAASVTGHRHHARGNQEGPIRPSLHRGYGQIGPSQRQPV